MSDPFESGHTPTAELHEAFTDVRRAFRLLWAYHRRVLDMLGEIDQSFKSLGLHFDSWGPTDCARPARGAPFAPGKWAWDLLPGARMGVRWRGTRRNKDVHAAAWVYGDETWEWRGKEPDPAEWSVPAEASRSMMWVQIVEGPRGADVEPAAEWMEEHDVHGAETFHIDGVEFRGLAILVQLEELPDQGALWDRVLRPVTEWWTPG